MVKHSYSSEIDSKDPKQFRESLGSFGTTTRPGGNQLQELQAKVRQGVKHVELHLSGKGKGQFGAQDTPDKYGQEQRRTIMQLAKLNNQSLSVHASFDITSFSGITQGGFNEAERATNISELDETLKFASQTAKQGAVVFHIQGDPISTSRSELNLSKRYLDWLEKNRPEEFERLKKNYFDKSPLHREFVDNLSQEYEVKKEFEKLKQKNPQKYQEYVREAEAYNDGRKPWEQYFLHKTNEKNKVSPDVNPLIVVGDKISQVDRKQEFIDISSLKKNQFSSEEQQVLKKLGLDTSKGFGVEEYFKATSIFTNGIPRNKEDEISNEVFYKLKNKLLITYDKVLETNYNLQGQADKEFHERLTQTQLELTQLQKNDLEKKYQLYKDELKSIKEYDDRVNELYKELDPSKADEKNKKIRTEIETLKNDRKKQELIYNKIGVNEYEKLSKYDETRSQLNQKIHELENQLGNVKAITDETFDKNTQAMGDLGIRALQYQLDMKQKSREGSQKRTPLEKEVEDLKKQYYGESDPQKRLAIKEEYDKKNKKLRTIIGSADYDDVDPVKKPLYLAPENMLPGYGSLTNLEEYKGVIRMSQEEFAEKFISNEPEMKQLREKYEKETGEKISTLDDARRVAKRHIAGTFDNAHAGAWLKHFRRKDGESEEERLQRFNQWLNSQAEEMYKDNVIKHVHFNDTQGKDDDHNLIGEGLLDVHDLKDRLRNSGFDESFIVEAGGRGADSISHLHAAWELFNPSLFADTSLSGGSENGYRIETGSMGSSVSDWTSVQRDYQNRPEYSQYGFGYSAFKHRPPERGPKGSWSGTGFL